MSRFYAIIFTIIFSIIFPIMSAIIFSIISDYCSLFSGCRHPENGNVQTAILDPIMEE
jgi:hypothetical protein